MGRDSVLCPDSDLQSDLVKLVSVFLPIETDRCIWGNERLKTIDNYSDISHVLWKTFEVSS